MDSPLGRWLYGVWLAQRWCVPQWWGKVPWKLSFDGWVTRGKQVEHFQRPREGVAVLLAPSVGERFLLGCMLHKTTPQDVQYRLYSNAHTPAAGDTLTQYVECVDPAYGPATLAGASWTVATAAGVTSGTYSQQTFSFSGAQTIYGYFVTTADGLTLLWAEQFSGGPITLASGGGTVQITPTITLT